MSKTTRSQEEMIYLIDLIQLLTENLELANMRGNKTLSEEFQKQLDNARTRFAVVVERLDKANS